MKKFMEEFKAFAMRGNVLDMAIGVVIGGAFGKITTSLVNDIIMPLVSILTGGVDFSAWKWVLKEAVMEGSEIVAPEIFKILRRQLSVCTLWKNIAGIFQRKLFTLFLIFYFKLLIFYYKSRKRCRICFVILICYSSRIECSECISNTNLFQRIP